jgi:hypothetical protein
MQNWWIVIRTNRKLTEGKELQKYLIQK